MATQISKLRLKNFKSFRKAQIPFDKGFTSIAGANGSGKSNILDAVLFALGITSLKMVRASKLTDLVNNGAVENYAQVEITLKHKGSEYEINRTIDKMGKSVCRLNGKRCTLNEIHSLLGECNIKVDGYNIVVQGDVTKIVKMTAHQRREIIDDLAGLKEFDEKKEEALKDLGKVETKIKEVRIVLNEREAHLKELEEEKNAALRYQELTEESKRSKATILALEVKKLEGSLAAFAEKEQAVKDKASQLLKERAEVKKAVQQLEERFEQINQQLISSSEKTFEGLGKSIEEKKSEVRVAEERNESKLALIARHENKITELTGSAEQTVKEAKQKKELIGKLKEKKSVLDKGILELEESVKQRTTDLDGKRRQSNDLRQEMNSLLNELSFKSQEYFKLKGELDAVAKEANLLERERRQWDEKRKKLGKRVEGKEEFSQEIKRILEAHGDVEEKLADFEARLNAANKGLNGAETRLEEVDSALKQLAQAKASCPVCDNTLSSKKKTDIVSLKKKEKTKLTNEAKQLKEKREGL